MPAARGGDTDDIRRPTRSHPTKGPGGDGHPRDAVLHAGGGGGGETTDGGGATEESCFPGAAIFRPPLTPSALPCLFFCVSASLPYFYIRAPLC